MAELKKYLLFLCCLTAVQVNAQSTNQDSSLVYKKRVLESVELDLLSSYYQQAGENAAVTGGKGTEELTDATGTIVISIPLNDDDILTIDAGVSAYSSASSSNIDPFDQGDADAFQASTGASSGDTWINFTASYSHSSDDRNKIWSAKVSISSEYDYFSAGAGGSYTRLFNEKNTELSFHGNVFIDTWNPVYPIELRPFGSENTGLNGSFFRGRTITGNTDYDPIFSAFQDEGRNTYSFGLGFSQILHKNVQASLALDLVQQQGLLSTPFQRVYFSDIADSFIDGFHLADAIEQLPDSRSKLALGGRLNWYLNEFVTIRTFYRYYRDDWNINSHTSSIEIPIKISYKFTLYPSYRFYYQSAASYFNPYNSALSTDEFYTSDFDLSEYSANQLGFGISYTDIFTNLHLLSFGLKSIDVKFYKYDRNTSFQSSILTAGLKFVMD